MKKIFMLITILIPLFLIPYSVSAVDLVPTKVHPIGEGLTMNLPAEIPMGVLDWETSLPPIPVTNHVGGFSTINEEEDMSFIFFFSFGISGYYTNPDDTRVHRMYDHPWGFSWASYDSPSLPS